MFSAPNNPRARFHIFGTTFAMNGFLNHLALTLRLNFRNKQAMVFGYLVPVFFLFAFGSLYPSEKIPLRRELGQVLTISTLGGACFGLPVALVTERERGVWRRYRLAPLATGWFVASSMLARFLIVATSALLQIVLAMSIYKTPLPEHPLQLIVAFAFVSFAFLGMGLVIAMVANSAGAVQALGQAIFLPMIIIGGVGVRLQSLPHWAQHVAGFLPGRYAVEAMNKCVMDTKGEPEGLRGAVFQLIALTVIGLAACLIGSKLFRWENEQKSGRAAKWWVLLGLSSWAAVGLAAEYMHVIKPV